MQIELTAEQQEFVRRALATGRVRGEADAVRQALDLWVERERRREEVLAAIDEAEAQFARGEGIAVAKEAIRVLADDVKRRGRVRAAARRPVSC
jgi:Arc/MetJ-type ribon-helix-helix transcriptional regulator